LRKKFKKNGSFSFWRKTISQSHMRVGKRQRERKEEEEERKELLPLFLSCLEE
jgi:hypothetical protein